MESYAVIKTGGKQYAVHAGDVLEVELLPGATEGDSVELATLATRTEEGLQVGTPELPEKVKATVIARGKDEKVTVLKWRRRTNYRKKTGHRQPFHAIRIESIPGNK